MDGDELVMMHTAEHLKVRNLRHDPRVVISIESETRSQAGIHPPFQLYLVVYGTATIIEGAARDHALLICANYGSAAPPNVPPGYVTRVTVDRVGGVGPGLTSRAGRQRIHAKFPYPDKPPGDSP